MKNYWKPQPKPTNPFEPIPVGEVSEGNEESDWVAWEDSVAFQDSQMPSLQAPVALATKAPESASEPSAEHVDIFASVQKNSA